MPMRLFAPWNASCYIANSLDRASGTTRGTPMNQTLQIPRPEHPRPQFEREDWINLNGTWTFEFDFGHSGRDAGRTLYKSQGFDREITVPFCPESRLSGVGHTDFIEDMWYHRQIGIPAAWKGRKVLLHFGGVDFESEIYVDGVSAGFHFGGSASFTHDLTPYVKAGATHDLVVRVHDVSRGSSGQPRGKQCSSYKSAGCHYTRTTGIWQTVWLEAVSPVGIRDCQTVADFDGARFILTPSFHGLTAGNHFRATLLDGEKVVAETEVAAADGVSLVLPVAKPKAWSPASPFLYGLRLEVVNRSGKTLDSVGSYAGLRKVHIEGDRIFLNNKPVYLRLVLDQGFYPDGIWTAPTDGDLRRDIELSMAAGFNGARLHQKVFEERFHYWADRLGYLTWGESASWGCDVNDILSARHFLGEWAEIVVRDRNHPSIIAWTPFNETGNARDLLQHTRLQVDAYNLCKALDPTRPVNDASGYIHHITDLWTIHNYDRPDKLGVIDAAPGTVWAFEPHRAPQGPYRGQPYLIDEFGGLKWIPPDRRPHADNTWGYGSDIPDLETFYKILSDEVDLILSVKRISGYCYTQLTDVEQEQNGVYNYDRTTKFDMKRIRGIFARRRPGGK